MSLEHTLSQTNELLAAILAALNTTPAPVAATTAAPPEKASPAETPAAVSYEEAGNALLAYQKEHGTPAAKARLHSIKAGAQTLRDLDPSDYPAVLKACQECVPCTPA